MTPKKEETAEQKLLKMIEAGSEGKGQSEKKSSQKVSQKQNILTVLKTAGKVLMLALILSVLFLGYEIYAGLDLVQQEVEISLEDDFSRSSNSALAMPTVQRLSYYLASIRKRDIFSPYEAPTGTAEVKSGNEGIARAIRDYRLVGIAWFETVASASVMIEDTKKNTTYFLQKGEKLGDIHVKTIYADSALLGYKDEEIIIRYDKPQI